jgi:hypothetical protein
MDSMHKKLKARLIIELSSTHAFQLIAFNIEILTVSFGQTQFGLTKLELRNSNNIPWAYDSPHRAKCNSTINITLIRC